MLITDKASTVPWIASPIPARFVITPINKFLFGRLAKEIIRENSIVINAVISPRPMVFNDKVSNSIETPCGIWSILRNTQKHGIPKEKIGGNKDIVIAKRALFFFNFHPWEACDAGLSLHLFDFLLENFSC